MAIIKPFSALRPRPENAKSVACVPYDVVYESEVRDYIANNSLSFLRVTRPEAQFPEGQRPGQAEVFAKARETLEEFINDRILEEDGEEDFYVYQLETATHSQTGVVGCCSVDDYEAGRIRKHEKVRPDKVEERTAHLLAVGAQTGLIFLAFRGTEKTHSLINVATKEDPIYEFECPAGVMQRVWRVLDTAPYIEAFQDVDSLYIADGHHRIESAKNAREALRAANREHTGNEDYNYVVAGMFPAEDLKILAYNRVVKDLNGLTAQEFIAALSENFQVEEMGQKIPRKQGDICLYLPGSWFRLRFTGDLGHDPDPIKKLDVSMLHAFILGPILGIGDERTDERIGFVGGIRGTPELERIVDEGIVAVAFSMYPTTMDDLFAVTDSGEVMPPKSTWFEPKLKDGLLIHLI